MKDSNIQKKEDKWFGFEHKEKIFCDGVERKTRKRNDRQRKGIKSEKFLISRSLFHWGKQKNSLVPFGRQNIEEREGDKKKIKTGKGREGAGRYVKQRAIK